MTSGVTHAQTADMSFPVYDSRAGTEGAEGPGGSSTSRRASVHAAEKRAAEGKKVYLKPAGWTEELPFTPVVPTEAPAPPPNQS
jgi:hypothetical protein